jgi:hypothetical protein
MSVGLFSVAEIFIEGVHKNSFQPSAVSFQLNIGGIIFFASGYRLW